MKESNHSGKKTWKVWLVMLGIVAIIVAVVLVLVMLMQGSTKTSGEFPDPEEMESLTCVKNGEVMSLIKTDGAKELGTKISMTFDKGKMRTISVDYALGYGTDEEIEKSGTINHAQLNLSSQDEGLGPDVFNLHFSKSKNKLDIRMYAEAEKITNVSAKYLMLEQVAGNYSMNAVKSNYVSQGFTCD